MQLYARHILVTLQAVHPRILALHAECKREAAAARTRRRGWQVGWARRQGPNPEPWPRALQALTRSSQRDIATRWALGAELADCAARMISEAGADRDARARARLLASTNHTLTHDVLGAFLPPDVEARDAAELARTLAEIDEPDTDPP